MSTVLIAAPEHLQALKERPDFSDAQTFSDAEALRALEVITRKRPDVVALERMFAATTRGAALINRIKADPKLASCEIRIVAHDSGYARVPAGGGAPGSAGSDSEAAVAVAEAPAASPLDQRGTRRAPRVKIIDGVEVLVDGNAATLVDLSIVVDQRRQEAAPLQRGRGVGLLRARQDGSPLPCRHRVLRRGTRGCPEILRREEEIGALCPVITRVASKTRIG
ncbi:MAG: hypothetical protein DMF88_18625 [Acidobacteria bacterium]|nr:MAG: hypothetical protein DMF88_18625 [Acidobacteriota bacterium]